MLSKTAIFVLLALFAVAFLFLGLQSDAAFLHDLWSQLFWLTLGTILTTFVLGTILERDQVTRSRNEDLFAFRTFTSSMMRRLLEIGGSPAELRDLLVRTLFDKREFADATEKAAQFLSSSAVSLSEGDYLRHYLDIAGGLRDLSRNYIRVFSSSRQEMVDTYYALQSLAARWGYSDALSEGFRDYTESLSPADDNRRKREEETRRRAREAQEVMKDTASFLSQLAHRASTYRGMPPP
jgi:hypothetical protein